MSDSLRPHGAQPTRLLSPWNSPGKNTGVGCHFLLPLKGHRSFFIYNSSQMPRSTFWSQWCDFVNQFKRVPFHKDFKILKINKRKKIKEMSLPLPISSRIITSFATSCTSTMVSYPQRVNTGWLAFSYMSSPWVTASKICWYHENFYLWWYKEVPK